MNMHHSARRGSALLIVLGMVAFMVISAVAFSAYMRFSRLPSSYLRRTVASRMLTKAALAAAIQEIDRGIGNNCHPGIMDVDQNGTNKWQNHVYIGQVSESTSTYTLDATPILAPQYKTVATLSLEGLAYIPPPLVNEARYFSRHSWAGAWHWLPYDSGRYAFCAIDVSDYLDINALRANVARTSNPESRISLAYLFDTTDPDNPSGNDNLPKEWDKLMQQIFDQAEAPVVSMADWNLAVGALGGSFKSPFYEYIRNGSTSFYDSNQDLARRMPFVTDSYLQATSSSGNSDDDDLDLQDKNNQPINPDKLVGDQKLRVSDLLGLHGGLNTTGRARLAESVPGIALVGLADYLDENQVPASLAMPTTERVPMICSIRPEVTLEALEFATTMTESDEPIDDNSRTRTRTIKCTLGGLEKLRDANVKVKLAYPFRHYDDAALGDEFTVDGRLAFFLMDASKTLKFRGGDMDDLLHNKGADAYNQSEFNDGVIALKLQAQSNIGLPAKIKSSFGAPKDQVVIDVPSMVADGASAALPPETFMEITYKWVQTKQVDDAGGETWTPESPTAGDLDAATCAMIPLSDELKADETFSNLKTKLTSGSFELKLCAAMWVRVKYNDHYLGESVVDMVPACTLDDSTFSVSADNAMDCKQMDNMYANAYPLMKFESANLVKFDADKLLEKPEEFSTSLTKEFKIGQQLLVGDPRFNYAPENWFTAGDGADWYDECGYNDSGCDGDVFMSVSDQGYLQSKYELANLIDFGTGDATWGSLPLITASSMTEFPNSRQGAAQYARMWKTITPFGTGTTFFDEVGFCNNDTGFRINPYTDSPQVLMAALANTPLEWRFSSTNFTKRTQMNIPKTGLESEFASSPDKYNELQDFIQDYCWNEQEEGDSWRGKLKWETLEQFGEVLTNKLRTVSGNSDNIEKRLDNVWKQLGWRQGSESELTSLVSLEGYNQAQGYFLSNADKKFLYGYWRECFAVKQQLFLIFVRSEPTMMGGGAIGATPPQLANRAVALVWRDPNKPQNSNNTGTGYIPHRTRVLFYRQLD